MADFFEGLKKMSDDMLRLQIAMIRNVTLYNSAMETGTRAVNKLISTAGSFLSSLRGEERNEDSDLLNVKIRKVHDLIRQTVEELSKEGSASLMNIMRRELAQRIGNMPEGEKLPEDELIWCQTVRLAAGAYALDIRQPVTLLADSVAEQYRKHMLRVLHARLVKENETERNKTDAACTLALRVVDIGQLRGLNMELQLAQFNPKSIMGAVRADRSVRTLEKLINIIGFEAFDTEKCVIQCVNDAVKSLIGSERVLAAHLIYDCQRIMGKKYCISRDLLPSFVNDGRSNGVNEVDIRYIERIHKAGELEKNLTLILSDISKAHKKQAESETDLLRAAEEMEKAQQENEEAKWRSDEAQQEGSIARLVLNQYESQHPAKDNSDMEYRQIRSRYEKAAAEIRNTAYQLERAKKQLERCEKRYLDMEKRVNEYNKEALKLGDSLFECSKEYNETIFSVDNETLERSVQLRSKWKNFFKTLSFDINVFEIMVKLFSTSQINKLEVAVWELEQAKNPKNYCHEYEKSEEASVLYCLVASGKYARICYTDKNIKNITIKER